MFRASAEIDRKTAKIKEEFFELQFRSILQSYANFIFASNTLQFKIAWII
jgi:hypothetical protein